ncbi:50S ribosome-binding GTPase, partial [archaeon]|nr:50S ribosome-binding GTPase [archaeon]
FSVGVIGYPNTGKSSIINLLIGKKSAKTGAVAGFTKGLQKLKLSRDIVLVDSPGVIPKREYSSVDAEKISQHAMIGARDYHKIKEPELTVAHLIKMRKPLFEDFYKIKFKDAEDFIEKLGKKKNIFKKHGEINEDKVARLIVKDWQSGKIV